jgi:3-deoxy-D-manno-octulosonic-acid transferase
MNLRWFLPLYTLLWHVGLPVAVLYLWWRGRRDPDYARHMGERFGRYRQRMQGAVWVHAVSLGEVRSAVPIVRALLDRGESVVLTHFTPAGRREAERVFANDIAIGRVAAVWVPVETGWAFAAFFRAFRPRAGLVMEVEHWPRMILSARRHGVPLFPCNAQYPLRSFTRDRGGWRMQAIGQYAGALVKSDLQADRFRAAGLKRIAVTGETRFDQPVPPALVAAGLAVRGWLAPGRRVAAFASVVEGEDDTYLSIIRELLGHPQKSHESPLILYIPRRPERFDETAERLTSAGLRIAPRSALLDPAFAAQGAPPQIDVLLGDSLGEMYAYLAMADRVVVGGGFRPSSAHNIIEPLALGKPVLTGPVTWSIEYPMEEAKAAGVAIAAQDAAHLTRLLQGPDWTTPAQIAAFFAAHSGAAGKTLEALDQFTRR